MMDGRSWIGNNRANYNINILKSVDAFTGNHFEDSFYIADYSEVDKAVEKAQEAFQIFSVISGDKRAAFLEEIAFQIEALGDALLERANRETGLPMMRLEGERKRTCSQLRLFAAIAREAVWSEPVIDTGDNKPDIRKMSVAIGPVVVFGASNFPLAFSTAGGDTASALAAGCPVIVKAHQAHLGVNDLVSAAIIRAAKNTGMPDGVFSSLNGKGAEIGAYLVRHPKVKAVGFTGSFNGGMALHQLAQGREEPIPVFAEMGSINPVVLFPQALALKKEEWAERFSTSITMGMGQFCTNPGLLIGIRSEAFTAFKSLLAEKMDQIEIAPMLSKAISETFQEGLAKVQSNSDVKILTNRRGKSVPTLAAVSGKEFMSDPMWKHELFGPFSLVVECSGWKELLEIIESLSGQLTATVIAEEEELFIQKEIIAQLKHKAGRISFNTPPTGVEVCHAMVHGGPFPATSDARFTSVGADAIKRFARPLCYQNFPEALLPQILKDENPNKIMRKINGKFTTEAIPTLIEK